MTFKIDENLPTEAADILRQAGHAADTAAQQGLRGARDPVLAAAVRGEGRVLVTLDTGIGDIRSYPPQDYPGRPRNQDKPTILRMRRRLI